MEPMYDLLDRIRSNGCIINTFNIFISDEEYKTKFNSLIQGLKSIDEFKNLSSLFPNVDLSLIRYIKTYSTLEEEYKNIVLFNHELYDDATYESDQPNPNISFRVLHSNENTDKVIKYVSCKKTFISDFIEKQNKKVFVSIPMLKAVMFNREAINLDLKTNQKEFDSKVYKQGKKDFLLKKERFIEFSLNKEQLLTTVRFILPNVFIICLEDQSYLYQSKIILSDKLQIKHLTFNNMKDKVRFIIALYERIYSTPLKIENVFMNISIKRANQEKIKNNPFLFNLPTNLIITDTFINFKYVTDLNDYEEREKVIKRFELKQKSITSFFKRVDKNVLLFFNDNNLDLIFRQGFASEIF